MVTIQLYSGWKKIYERAGKSRLYIWVQKADLPKVGISFAVGHKHRDYLRSYIKDTWGKAEAVKHAFWEFFFRGHGQYTTFLNPRLSIFKFRLVKLSKNWHFLAVVQKNCCNIAQYCSKPSIFRKGFSRKTAKNKHFSWSIKWQIHVPTDDTQKHTCMC